jgi:hypothetical protein
MKNLLTPSRESLADLQRQRADKLAAVKAEVTASNVLARVHDDVAPARAALAAFDSQQSAALSNWARGRVTGRPTAAAAHRAELVAAVADAEQASADATAAQAECQANVERLSAPLAGIDKKIREAAKIVIIEQSTALLPEVKAAIETAENLRHRLDAARAEVMNGFEFGRNDYPEAGAALVAFDAAREAAQARPVASADTTSWRKFAAALERDAKISFEDAQAMAVPPTPISSISADVATAAMNAAMSYPSNGIQR